MVVHAACGGSTNLLLHVPAIAYAAGLPRPTVEDWIEVNRSVPRLVDVLPNGPANHPTVRVFLAGGVPEVMLHLRELNLLDLDVLTATGYTLGEVLDWWQSCQRRQRLRALLRQRDGVDPDDVIMAPARSAAARSHQHGLLPGRQSLSRRIGDQSHGDRSGGRGCRTASIAIRDRRASSPRNERRLPPSRDAARTAACRRETSWC